MKSDDGKKQAQMLADITWDVGLRDRTFMELLNHPTNPLTKDDVRKLIARDPARDGRYKGFS